MIQRKEAFNRDEEIKVGNAYRSMSTALDSAHLGPASRQSLIFAMRILVEELLVSHALLRGEDE